MERLYDAIREKHAQGDRCQRIDDALAMLIARKVPTIDGYLLSPVSSLPSKIADLLQLGARRSIDLAESAIREMNLEQLNSSCMLSRGVLETVCLMLYLSGEVEKAVESPDSADLPKLNEFAANTLLGSGPKAKTFFFKEEHRVTNILTIILKLDKDLGTPFGGFYEGLSEHAHPNAHGMALTYVETHHHCVTTYTEKKQSRVDVSLGLAISALATALQIAEMALTHWDRDRDRFIALAEKKLHDAGTWPEGEPYPVKRETPEASPRNT